MQKTSINPENAQTLLRMEGVDKSFGATQALEQVSIEIRSGEAMALIGENGAGKSTLMKILSGAFKADKGNIFLNGNPFKPTSPHEARAAGIAMIYQELNLANDLNVEDNIMLGQEIHRFGILQHRAQREKIHSVLELLGHPELKPQTVVGSMSVGARQLVEIARALVINAKLIVFDEPTSSLAQHDVEHLFRVIRTLKQSKIGIVYISHFLEEIVDVCDRYTVLRDGKVAGTGEIREASERQIVSLMVGRSVEELFPTVPHAIGETVLSLNNICGNEIPQDISIELKRGEIFGIAGLVGSGRTELLRAVFGLDPIRKGEIRIAGANTSHTPRARILSGLGFVSEDRKGEGLAQTQSVADNLTLSHLKPYRRFGWLNLLRRQAEVEKWMQNMQIKAHSPEQQVQTLSGGNQQKVALARVLHQDADVLLLDEPTRGIDVGTKSEIYRWMGKLAVQGKAILFVSSYLPELLAVCDRIGVMTRGKLREVRPTDDWSEEEVMTCAVKFE